MLDVLDLLAKLGIRVEKRAGNRLWSRCPSPDHDDKDPSWYVWNDPGERRHCKHRCYGCGFRGGPLGLVVEVRGGDYDDARAWLARGVIDNPQLDVELMVLEQGGIMHLRDVAREAPPFVLFGLPYKDWPVYAQGEMESKRPTIRDRGQEVVTRWDLGVALKGTLAGRIYIPIVDTDGRSVSWQARTYVGDELRYMTPKAGPSALFGQRHWPEPEDRDVVVVVEGPFDAIAVDRALRLPVAALCGSNPVPRQLAALATFRRVIVMTDSDAAGDKVAAELQGLARWTRVRRVRLPDGLDPGAATEAQIGRIMVDRSTIGRG